MNKDNVFFAATAILAAHVGQQGQDGIHASPALVAKSVELAEMLVEQLEKRDEEARSKLPPLPEPVSGAVAPAK